ncbi:MAG: ABC transporter ATP-binding protein [Acidimicrobiia bacterium]|nr:ABC transporter ATP-binding protein [Acidimicrobiia bacterium]
MSNVDPRVVARAGSITAPSTDSAVRTIGRGLETAPVLRQGLAFTWVLAAIGASGRVVVPILIQQSIDRGIVGQSEVRIDLVVQLALVGVVAVLISGFALRHAALRLGVRSERALYDLRVRLIGHIHRLSLADHSEEQRGGLVARVTSDIETLAQFFQWGGLAWLLDGTLMLIVGSVMIAYDWILALVAFAVAFPLVFVLRAVQARLVVAYDAARQRNGEMLGSIAEVVTGARTIRAYDAGPAMDETVKVTVAAKAHAQVKAALIGAFLFPSGEVFSVFTVTAVIGVGVGRGPDSGLTAGALIGFIFLTYRFLEPIGEFTEVLDQTQTAVAGLRRVLSVLDMPVGPPTATETIPLPEGQLAIDVRDVTFSYRSRDTGGHIDEPVLQHIDLAVPPGQDIALVGATGSGKTTLGRLFARFADPTLGEIDIGGVDLRSVDPEELRRRVIVVSQEPFLFDDTIEANIGFARPEWNAEEVRRVVTDLGIEEWVDSLSNGMQTRVGERGEAMSAGERQLVGLLRAGYADPDILILDEATSSVDALTEVRIARALERLAATRTTIAIAHRLSTAARADRVLVLDGGRLVEDGTHTDLLAAGGVYERLYEAWVSATSV